MMKKHFGAVSIQALIVAVLLAAIFFRGENQWMILLVVAAWAVSTAVWTIYLHRQGIRRRLRKWFPKQAPDKRLQEQEDQRQQATPEAELVVLQDESEPPSAIVLRYLNCRISDKLKSAYPEVTWCWEADQPELLALKGGTGRIALHQAGEYTHAEITVDQYARIDFKMLRMVNLNSLIPGADKKKDQGEPATTDASAWFDLVGRQQLTAIITELNTRGHSKLSIAENGDVFVVEDDAPAKQDTLDNLPGKNFWQDLVQLISDTGVKARVDGEQLRVSW